MPKGWLIGSLLFLGVTLRFDFNLVVVSAEALVTGIHSCTFFFQLMKTLANNSDPAVRSSVFFSLLLQNKAHLLLLSVWPCSGQLAHQAWRLGNINREGHLAQTAARAKGWSHHACAMTVNLECLGGSCDENLVLAGKGSFWQVAKIDKRGQEFRPISEISEKLPQIYPVGPQSPFRHVRL